ncbi:hypothetical protein EDB81DRAFT_764362 [Dactylonectria macrodidyma]|uniref:Uncharacterized protein n=1 Tax=Dactylonectria macrodidyma TaxID=307937 RepID=A0A9P9IQC8_9HYPO|nr:hypothetical protein EDB81DRAFT_764362 [Dactylonectria macrodidyma]
MQFTSANGIPTPVRYHKQRGSERCEKQSDGSRDLESLPCEGFDVVYCDDDDPKFSCAGIECVSGWHPGARAVSLAKGLALVFPQARSVAEMGSMSVCRDLLGHSAHRRRVSGTKMKKITAVCWAPEPSSSKTPCLPAPIIRETDQRRSKGKTVLITAVATNTGAHCGAIVNVIMCTLAEVLSIRLSGESGKEAEVEPLESDRFKKDTYGRRDPAGIRHLPEPLARDDERGQHFGGAPYRALTQGASMYLACWNSANE